MRRALGSSHLLIALSKGNFVRQFYVANVLKFPYAKGNFKTLCFQEITNTKFHFDKAISRCDGPQCPIKNMNDQVFNNVALSVSSIFFHCRWKKKALTQWLITIKALTLFKFQRAGWFHRVLMRLKNFDATGSRERKLLLGSGGSSQNLHQINPIYKFLAQIPMVLQGINEILKT